MENNPANIDDAKSNPADVSVPILSPQDIPTVLGGNPIKLEVETPSTNTITQEFAALQLQQELASMQLQFQKEVLLCLFFVVVGLL